MDFKKDITQLQKDDELLDIRDQQSFLFGHISGAKSVPRLKLDEFKFEPQKNYFLYCRNGKISQKIAQSLQSKGINAFFVDGGYTKWLEGHLEDDNTKTRCLKAEESIRKKYHRELLTKFCRAINDYELISPGDKIAVCMSGGKDSFLMAKLFQELKRHNKIDFSLEFLVMDPGYNSKNRKLIEDNAKLLNIPIKIFETDIFENVFHVPSGPCYLCARMRRGHLYNKAKELGCNKIALGHHFDDVIETILMGMLFGAQVQTMMPKLHSNNFEGMQLIRPMYLVRERDVKRWRDYNGLNFLQCACKFTENIESSKDPTYSIRQQVKQMIATLEKQDDQIPQNIFRSVEGVNLSTIISYKDKDGKIISFLDDYDK